MPIKSERQFTLPTGWTSEQAWAIVELLDIISSDIWDIYEDRLLDHVRRKRSKTCDENGMAEPAPSYDCDKNGSADLPF